MTYVISTMQLQSNKNYVNSLGNKGKEELQMALSRETEKKQPNEQQSYKGTLLSVGFVAAVILAMWIGVFWIYMIRV